MFNSESKGSQRCNGFVSPTDNSKIIHQISYNKLSKPLGNKETYNNINKSSLDYDSFYDKNLVLFNNCEVNNKFKGNNESDEYKFMYSKNKKHYNSPVHGIEPKVKIEIEENIKSNITANSIIGAGEENIKTHKLLSSVKQHKRGKIRTTYHETLQRIESDCNYYQQSWFSTGLEKVKLEDKSREERIEITRHEFTRHLQQIVRSNVGQHNKVSDVPLHYIEKVKKPFRYQSQDGYDRLVQPTACEIEHCTKPALPCSRHCTLHIMFNTEQVLFRCCTAKFSDNTQCSIPIFDITHELPLCPEHARKKDNYKLCQEAKPKKLRKKVKPSAMIRPQKRNKKRKRPIKLIETTTPSALIGMPVTNDLDKFVDEDSPELEEDMHMVDQVLGLNESRLEQVLETQASHLLEETDISTVLSTIQVDDEFSDFFTVNRNGEYEPPSREETEELEKALLAVDNDVKSLEKLSQSQGLLDSLLDEHTLAESLVQIPDVFHNGYTQCGDNMVAQTSSFLLPVEPQSHT